jgi:ferric-dicitrate binding protein FerR (iron transport regulator)
MLSAYLDGKLSQADSTRLEARLAADPELDSVLADLGQARSLLRRLPQRRSPRNFTLSPQKAGVRPPLPRAYPVLRLASALAAVLFFFTFLGANVALPAAQLAAPAAEQDRFASGGGGAPTEAPAESAPIIGTLPPGTPTPEMGIALAPPEPTPEPARDQAKAAAPASVQPWQGALLALAILLGASALFIRWRADRAFRRKTGNQG